MSFANNLAGKSKRASFQTAGGSSIKLRHPYLAGQLATGNASIDGSYDEIDISSSCKLDDEYFRAEPLMDSSKQVVMVDGSTVTITNDIQAGTINMQLVPTTGLVGSGDAIAAMQLIAASKDTVGGVLTLTEYINGKCITTFYYGISIKNVPQKIKVGNDVPVYSVQLLYAGWIVTVADSAASAQSIWAAGNDSGVTAIFKQLGINQGGADAATIGTAVGDTDINDTSLTSGIVNADATTLSGINADNDMLGVVYSDGNSVELLGTANKAST